ncbi:hypothetical protein H310_08983 [Aphanomyces invadans]|uniref:N-acetyltransferase domain-containing protein n=1 Tax=Aphanomyces invadans TaxID=157072 RepID=A0A024TW95_9STRA|nr:hypothetical protein H310_08983 [Aphanomyces invadans]ETV98269.1 hypothetical protein H310_08983 [Aphanomyces invadans]|eukprot:XP_008873144.1 hypothetical protein H310_08983 [Aphanomyces invadans]
MSLCRVCNHHHEEGVRCSICGHTGKSKVFQFLKANRPINQLRFVSFRVNGNSDNPCKGNWCFARLLRERNFGTASTGLFDDSDVKTANHVLTFVGDAPVAAARWGWAVENGVEIAVIDKLGVVDIRRRRTYGTYTLTNIIEDIKAKVATESRLLYAIVAHVPHDPTHPAWKTFVKCGFQPMGEPIAIVTSPDPCAKMVLRCS